MTRTIQFPIAAIAFLLAAAFSPASAAQTGGVSFARPVTRPTVLYASAITAGDLDNDGESDLGVAAATGDDELACIALHPLYDADLGRYHYPWNCDIDADYPSSILFADMDLDGNLDVITTGGEGPDIEIAFGNGKGQFTHGTTISFECTNSSPVQAAVADLNGDGIPDIVAIYSGYSGVPGCVAVFLGTGSGQFAPPIGSSSGGDEPFSMAVGDLNNDGIPDLVISNYGGAQGVTGNLAVMLGKGDGTFGTVTTYSAPSYQSFPQVILGDFNNDGKLDVAFTTYHAIHVALGNGDGTFSSPRSYRVRQSAAFIAAADFNGDGILDLAVSVADPKPPYSGGVAISLSNGDGTLQKPKFFPVGFNLGQCAVGDFNSDGKPDIAVLNNVTAEYSVSILLNTTPWPKVVRK